MGYRYQPKCERVCSTFESPQHARDERLLLRKEERKPNGRKPKAENGSYVLFVSVPKGAQAPQVRLTIKIGRRHTLFIPHHNLYFTEPIDLSISHSHHFVRSRGTSCYQMLLHQHHHHPNFACHHIHNHLPHLYYIFFLLVTLLPHHAHGEPLFSLQRYDTPYCNPIVVPHTITLPAPTSPSPILRTQLSIPTSHTLPFSPLQSPPDTTLIILSADLFPRDRHLDLLAAIHLGFVIAFKTTALTDADPDLSLLTDLAVFETLTGILLPFYVTTPSTAYNMNATIPLFQIVLPAEEEHTQTAATQASRNDSDETPIPLSVLDFMNAPQLRCLLSRLECHKVASDDLTFNLCAACGRRLHSLSKSHTLHANTKKKIDGHKLQPTLPPDMFHLIYTPIAKTTSAKDDALQSEPTFALKRARVRNAVAMATHTCDEERVRVLLFGRSGQKGRSLIDVMGHDNEWIVDGEDGVSLPSLWVRFLLCMVPFSSGVCRALAVGVLLFGMWRSDFVCRGGVISRRAKDKVRQMLTRAFANRAKLT